MAALTDKLRIGMSIHELIELLGQPVGTNPGDEMLSGSNVNGFGDIVGLRRELARTDYCMWRRPEGEYLLVLVNGCLDRITSAPGYVLPSKPVSMGTGERDVCAGCGRTRDQIEAHFKEMEKRGALIIGTRNYLLFCDDCQKAWCGRCQVDLGMASGCPQCRKALD
jgi:hypothetical protein